MSLPWHHITKLLDRVLRFNSLLLSTLPQHNSSAHFLGLAEQCQIATQHCLQVHFLRSFNLLISVRSPPLHSALSARSSAEVCRAFTSLSMRHRFHSSFQEHLPPSCAWHEGLEQLLPFSLFWLRYVMYFCRAA